MLSVVCVAFADCCLIYIILFMHLFCNGHASLFLHAVTVFCTNDLCLVFPNYVRVVVCDY